MIYCPHVIFINATVLRGNKGSHLSCAFIQEYGMDRNEQRR